MRATPSTLATLCAGLAMACGSTNTTGSASSTGEAPPKAAVAKAAPVATPDGPPAGQDVSAEIEKMNSKEFAAPPDTFRKGHVSQRQAPAIKRTKQGYEVQFPSRAPITTPAVYQGKVFVSGGFRSKEYYAFNATTGKPAWAVNLDDDGPSTTACADGICVFNTESCTVFAVDAETGKQRWSWWLGDPLTSSPTIAGGQVFTSYPATGVAKGDERPRPPGASHALIALDLRSGKILWQKWLDSDVMTAPVAMEGYLYVSTFGGTIMKVEQATGKVRYAIRARATSAPVIDFSRGVESMYFTSRPEADDEGDVAEEQIIRTDHNHPKTKYKAARKKADYLDKKVQSKSGYAAEGKENDSANGFSGGAPASANPSAAYDNVGQASVHTMQAFQGSRVLHVGDRNVNTMGDEVVATSAETGEKLWSYKLPGDLAKAGGFLGTAPLAAGSRVLMATLAGEVLALDPSSGKVKNRWKVGGKVRSQPVVADGWIYVGTEDGRLVAIDTGDRSLTGWPMFGGDAARTGIKTAKR